MRTTRKLLVLCLAALMTCVAMMPASFSWYAHNESVNGGYMQYSRSALPVSGSSTGTSAFNVSTIAVDKNGEPTHGNTAVSTVNFSSASTNVQYYKTTLNNTGGSGDVYGELDLGNLLNSVDVKAGITSPVINEKGFDISKTPTAYNQIRIYFLPTSAYSAFWYDGNSSSSTFDMKLRYTVGSNTTDVNMSRKANSNSAFKDGSTGVTAPYVYYCDIPSNTNSFFFFNHWYSDSDENKDWNRTPDITDIVPGTIYRLTGKNIEDSYKLYDTVPGTELAGLMKYYSEAKLNQGGYIDISLKDSSEVTEGANPDFYGNTISYASSNTSVATVTKDGLVTAASSISGNTATANITTTITGLAGDTITCTTKVTVSKYIEQMPIAQNVYVKKGETVDLYWYVLNKSSSTGNIASSIFWTY